MITVAQSISGNREHIYRLLTAKIDENPNKGFLAKILASRLSGKSVLPDYMGLGAIQFKLMHAQHFPGVSIPMYAPSGIKLDETRMLEKEDLIRLLQGFSRSMNQESEWIIGLIVSACLGNDHLWQDLGFWQRSELSAFLAYNFPGLAERNSKDMKWKKFLYKQLCEAEGMYLCRASSCEVCTDYSNCYGPEE